MRPCGMCDLPFKGTPGALICPDCHDYWSEVADSELESA